MQLSQKIRRRKKPAGVPPIDYLVENVPWFNSVAITVLLVIFTTTKRGSSSVRAMYRATRNQHLGNSSRIINAAAMAQPAQPETKLLWNPENVKDVAESVGISSLNEDALRVLTQDAEYRIGQVVIEALRFMRAARRTTLTVGDIAQALRVLDVEPLYGYESTRPLRYGEASLGPGQPLYYLEDEEVDFEKLINAPLPKVPRDMSFTAHWLAIEGVQPSIPQNPTHRRVPKPGVATERALIENTNLFLDPYANAIAAPVLTCLLGRKLGADDATKDQYELREFSASLLGKIALRYAASNHLLRPKLVRTCLKFFMDPDKLPAAHYGAITGLAAAGGPEAVRVLVLKYLRAARANGVNGGPAATQTAELKEFIGPILGERIAGLGNKRLVEQVLEARTIQ
ncbi:transcription initiation factor TFIID complex 60 kDa subunit [Verticillium alfalfae VaMs.102]|uniref:TBP-associated factor 6 n=1 Tax=Verticillium alfalfae (strain VaMs.102 / ATCC MYA-4576 / FGSC 10136) TaxID=526221 RepID=C9SRR8_VERA1|nr:transcription initiation factor TFIID complex 60 kDa subunit [Verticillium alfalfae VaMs.102]EEY21483.1 transcription initiation factor TFIID complex 60 kDa subunit [Verticillium alfalfae VaMs.102]